MIKAIILDKDGTLIELGHMWDKPSIDVTNFFLSQTELSEDEQEAFRQHMGVKGEGILPNSIYAAGSIEDQAKAIDKIVSWSQDAIAAKLEEVYLDYVLTHSDSVKVMDGAKQALETLSQNYILAVVTNDNYSIAVETLRLAGLDQYFEIIASADDFGPKPNPSALFEISRRYNIQLDEMVYVGDSNVDMTYGKHTRASIGLAVDESHLEHLEKADYIITHFDQLKSVIERINQGGDQ